MYWVEWNEKMKNEMKNSNNIHSAHGIVTALRVITIDIFSDFIILGNYEDSLKDAIAATDLQPYFLKAIERGKFFFRWG